MQFYYIYLTTVYYNRNYTVFHFLYKTRRMYALRTYF